MSSKFKVILGIIVLIAIGVLIYFGVREKEETPTYVITTDSLQFKNEYEEYNGKINDANDKTYLSMDIKSYNPIKYSSYEEIFEILDSGSGVIYFGFPTCPWCRNLVPTLVDSAIDYGIETIYYLNNLEDRNTLSLNKKGKLQTDKKATEEYLKLVETLKEYLPVYKGLNDESIKRLYFPTVIFVKDGKVLHLQQSLKAFSERAGDNPYEPMNIEEKTALADIFKEYYQKIYPKK